MCAETTSTGPLPVPLRTAMTLPSASMRASAMPNAFRRFRYSAARVASLKGGAGISVSSICSFSVRSSSLLRKSMAWRTPAWVMSLANAASVSAFTGGQAGWAQAAGA